MDKQTRRGPLHNMNDSYQMPIQIESDENGFIDRECPNENCLFTFKIDLHDWEDKVVGHHMRCPRCGLVAPHDKWWTQGQLAVLNANIKSFALGLVHDELNSTFRQLERQARRNKYVRISYKPSSRPLYANLPISQTDAWETEITCDECGTRFSIIGNAYFCPCCGKDLSTNAIQDSLTSYRRRIDDLQKVHDIFKQDFSSEEAEKQVESIREDTLGSIVGTFESFCKARYAEMGGTNAKRGVFQRLRDGDDLFDELTGFRYEHRIGDDGLDFMNLMFNRRHLITHSNGIVDEQYLRKTGDTLYAARQRVIVRNADLLKLLDFIQEVVNGLLDAKPKESPTT